MFLGFAGGGQHVRDGSGNTRVGDGVLASDDGPVYKCNGDVMRMIGVDCGEDCDVFWDAADAAEEVNGRLERSREDAGTIVC